MTLGKKTLWDAYNAERDKLTQLPDADADFTALDNACKKLTGEANQ